MATSQPPTLWEATSDADRKLRDVVMEHNAVLDKCLVKTSPDQPEVFVLMPDTIHNLKKLMALGEPLPQEPNAFEGLYPKMTLKGFVNIDADIFEETKQLMVGVGNQCKQYLKSHDGELFNTMHEFSSFVLSAGYDWEWEQTAFGGVCKAIEQQNKRDIEDELRYIEKPHGKCKDKFDSTRNNWKNFKNEFVNHSLLQKLIAKYKGPFENPKAKNIAYLDWLLADATALEAKMENLTKKIAAEEDADIKEALQALSDKYKAEAQSERKLHDDVEKLLTLCAQLEAAVEVVIASLGVVMEVNEKSCALSREIKACIQNPGLDLLKSRVKVIEQSFLDAQSKYKKMIDPFHGTNRSLRNGIYPYL